MDTLRAASYPHSGLGQVGPHGDLLPGAHVRVAVPLEGGLQLLELLAGEVSPLPPLLLLLGVVPVAVIAAVLGAPLLLCGSQHSGISASSAGSTGLSHFKINICHLQCNYPKGQFLTTQTKCSEWDTWISLNILNHYYSNQTMEI